MEQTILCLVYWSMEHFEVSLIDVSIIIICFSLHLITLKNRISKADIERSNNRIIVSRNYVDSYNVIARLVHSMSALLVLLL